MLKMFDAFRARLTSEAQVWYKLWSSWLAILWGAVVAFFWYEPTTLSDILAVVPEPYRSGLSPVVGFVAAALPIIVRLLKQGPRNG